MLRPGLSRVNYSPDPDGLIVSVSVFTLQVWGHNHNRTTSVTAQESRIVQLLPVTVAHPISDVPHDEVYGDFVLHVVSNRPEGVPQVVKRTATLRTVFCFLLDANRVENLHELACNGIGENRVTVFVLFMSNPSCAALGDKRQPCIGLVFRPGSGFDSFLHAPSPFRATRGNGQRFPFWV